MPKGSSSTETPSPTSSPLNAQQDNERLTLRRNALFAQATSLYDQAKASTIPVLISAYFQSMLTLLVTFQQIQFEIRSNNELLVERERTNCDAVESSLNAILRSTAELKDKAETPTVPPPAAPPIQTLTHIHLPPPPWIYPPLTGT